MKIFFNYAARCLVCALTLTAGVFFTACPEGGTTIAGNNSAALINSVWAGVTPRQGDWLTISFKKDNKVILSFSSDNTTNEWTYTFDTANSGTFSDPEESRNPAPENPAPNGFTISKDTLTIVNYGNHAVNNLEFKRLRQADLTLAPVPFTPGTLDPNLINSVWAGETPRAGDWLTISFKPDNKVIWSFCFDNTTNEWEYSFDSTENSGTFTPSGPWNPAPNGFTIKDGILTVTNYGNHAGAPREFKRYR